jgi:hypothetical protein
MPNRQVPVRWEVARDEHFRRVEAKGRRSRGRTARTASMSRWRACVPGASTSTASRPARSCRPWGVRRPPCAPTRTRPASRSPPARCSSTAASRPTSTWRRRTSISSCCRPHRRRAPLLGRGLKADFDDPGSAIGTEFVVSSISTTGNRTTNATAGRQPAPEVLRGPARLHALRDGRRALAHGRARRAGRQHARVVDRDERVVYRDQRRRRRAAPARLSPTARVVAYARASASWAAASASSSCAATRSSPLSQKPGSARSMPTIWPSSSGLREPPARSSSR